MPEQTVKKVNLWGNTISTWGRIVIGLTIFIVGVGTTYYKIETNSSENIRQDDHIKEVLNTMNLQFEMWSTRSDKRYNRLMKEVNELHEHDDIKDKQLLELTKELYFLKGEFKQIEKNQNK